MSHRKNSLINSEVVTGQSMAASFVSQVTSLAYLDNAMIQLAFTGTPTGSFAVETSNDYDKNLNPDTSHWVALTLSGSPVATGAPDTILITLNQIPAPNIRLRYTSSGGTGSLDYRISAKEI